MPHFTLPIEANGPFVKALLSVSEARELALLDASKPVPTPVIAKGLIDTGASCTCVDVSVIKKLKITPSGEININTPSTKSRKPETMNQYDISLKIYESAEAPPYIIRNLPVIETELLVNQGFDALIGRDVLSKCVLVYNGSKKYYTLAF